MDKNKMHRAICIKNGKVKWVSPRLAKNPAMLLDYGIMLQELDEEIPSETIVPKKPIETESTDEASETNGESEASEKPSKRKYNKKQ